MRRRSRLWTVGGFAGHFPPVPRERLHCCHRHHAFLPSRRILPHAPGTNPASEPLVPGLSRLQVAEEQLWDTPHRPGMGMCPRGRCPRPAEGGWLCVQGGEAAEDGEERMSERRQGCGRI